MSTQTEQTRVVKRGAVRYIVKSTTPINVDGGCVVIQTQPVPIVKAEPVKPRLRLVS